MTVSDLLKETLQDLGILQSGEDMDPDDADLAFRRVNDWIDGLKTDGLIIYTVTRTTWALGSASSYTLGPLGTIPMARPPSAEFIQAIGYHDTAVTPTQEILVPVLTDQMYQAWPNKTMTGVYPTAFYYNATYGASGWATLMPLPVPTGTTLRGIIYAQTPIEEFTATTNILGLPPGYRRFYRTNLAVELSDAFDRNITPTMVQKARDSRDALTRTNLRQSDLGFDGAFNAGRAYSIWTDR